MRAQPLPDHAHKGFGGGEAARRGVQVEFRPGLIQEAEVELAGDLAADEMLHLRKVEHHPIGIKAARHGDNQLVVMTVARGQGTGTEASSIVISRKLRQPVTVGGTERGSPGNDTAATLAVTCSRLRFSHVTFRPDGILMS